MNDKDHPVGLITGNQPLFKRNYRILKSLNLFFCWLGS